MVSEAGTQIRIDDNLSKCHPGLSASRDRVIEKYLRVP